MCQQAVFYLKTLGKKSFSPFPASGGPGSSLDYSCTTPVSTSIFPQPSSLGTYKSLGLHPASPMCLGPNLSLPITTSLRLSLPTSLHAS